MLFTFENGVLLMRQGASVVWHHSLLLMNSFNKTEAAVFTYRLCFLRAFPFISLIRHLKRNFSKTYMFLLPMYLVYQNLFCGTLICPLSIWQLGYQNVSVEIEVLLTLFRDLHIYYKFEMNCLPFKCVTLSGVPFTRWPSTH